MQTSMMTATAALLIAAGAASAAPPGNLPASPNIPPVIVAKAPNLVPIASRMQKGTVSVRNTGSASAGPFKVTVECNAMGRTGGCVDPPRDAVAAYEDAAFPNKITVAVPSLSPGHVFSHKLTFWDALIWPSGNYEFTVVVDAGGAVAETNEGDNSSGTVLGIP